MSVHIKFKTAKDHESIALDGENISVIDLKKLLVTKKKLGKNFGIDYDLIVTNSLTGEDYKDDSTLIPRNTSVIISRLPISINRNMLNQIQANALAQAQSQANLAPAPLIVQKKEGEIEGESNPEQDESAKINALIQHSHASVPSKYSIGPPHMNHGFNKHHHGHHNHGQQQSSTGVHYHQLQTITIMANQNQQNQNQNQQTQNNNQQPTEIKIPHGSYICFRCNRPGHYINQCPTNGDPNYDHHKRKKAAGIPKTFLKPLSQHLNQQQIQQNTESTSVNNINNSNGINNGNSNGKSNQPPSIVLLNGGGVAVVTQNETEFTRLAKAIEFEQEHKKKNKENKENKELEVLQQLTSTNNGVHQDLNDATINQPLPTTTNSNITTTNNGERTSSSRDEINKNKKRNIDEVNSFSSTHGSSDFRGETTPDKKLKYDNEHSRGSSDRDIYSNSRGDYNNNFISNNNSDNKQYYNNYNPRSNDDNQTRNDYKDGYNRDTYKNNINNRDGGYRNNSDSYKSGDYRDGNNYYRDGSRGNNDNRDSSYNRDNGYRSDSRGSYRDSGRSSSSSYSSNRGRDYHR